MRLASPATFALAALLAASGCSAEIPPPTGGQGSGPATASASPTPASTAPAGTASASSTSNSSSPPPSAPSPSAAVSVESYTSRLIRGASAFKTATLSLTSEAEGTKRESTGLLDQSDKANPKLKLTTAIEGATVEVILIGGTTYTKTPSSGGKYAKSTNGGFSANQLVPALLAEEWKKAVTKVTFVGTEMVGGESTQHFVSTTETSDATRIDVWLDAQDRPVQTRVTFPGGSTTIAYGNFDAPESIVAPPASQVSG
jgi:hypothetical protein